MHDMAAAPPNPFAGLANLRDLGGVPVAGGRLRAGLVYRSDQLAGLGSAELEQLAGLRLGQVWDLRTAAERAAEPDRLPPGAAMEVADVLAEAAGAAPAQLREILGAPETANARFGGGRMAGYLASAYAGFVSLPSARDAYGRLFAALAAEDAPPLLFHCTAGKDRTGWAAAALLTLCGADPDVVQADYMASDARILGKYAALIDECAARGVERELLVVALGVRPEFLAAGFAEMEARFGDVEGYFAEGLGLDVAGQARLRARLVAAD